jgi:aryl-alcohol dehydrogenase-like predicted oxidoreductase
VVLLSKCYAGLPEDTENLDEGELLKRTSVNDGVMVNRVGLSRKHIFDAVDASIARLGTYMDVLQIHRLDRETPREEIMKALNDVVESGKARYIGACSVRYLLKLRAHFYSLEIFMLTPVQMAAWEFQSLQNIAKQNGWHQFISMQDYYSLLYRENEREMIPYCQDTGVGIIPFSPLARGLLTRPYGSQPTTRQKADIYSEFLLGEATSSDIEIIGRVEELARQKGVSMATVSLAWCVAKGVIPIVGLGSIDRVNQTVEGLALTKTGLLSKDDIDFLEQKYIAKPITVVI